MSERDAILIGITNADFPHSPRLVDGLARDREDRGVRFEHYDVPKMTRQGDLHVAGTMKTAWFKDPDGNIFSLVTQPNTATRQPVGASEQARA